MEIEGRAIGVRIIRKGTETKLFQTTGHLVLTFKPDHDIVAMSVDDYDLICKRIEELEAKVRELDSLIDFAELSIDEAAEAGWDPDRPPE